MIIQILWLLLLIVLVLKGYYKTVVAVVLLPLVLLYGTIFVLTSSRFENGSIPSRVDISNLSPFENLFEITAIPVKYETSIISGT